MLRLFALEARLMFRERLAWIVLAVAGLACIIGALQGRALMNTQDEGRRAYLAERAKVDEKLLESIRKATPESAATLPRSVGLPIVAPAPRLGDFTTGRARFEDYTSTARLGVRQDGMFKRTRFDNPELLARGSIDLGFVSVVVLPLLLIALGYGVFAADRDSGTARLIVAQQGSLTRLLALRSVPRLTLVLLPLVATAMVLLAWGPAIPGRGAAAMWWLLIAVLLVLFWWTLILLVNSMRVSAEGAALLLISIWAAFTLILPPAIAAGAQAANPPPSRFAHIAAGRAAELRASSDFENHHPELTDEAAERLRQVRLSQQIDRDVENAQRPLNAAFDENRQRQLASVRLLSFLSPASVAAAGQAAVAGTDGETSSAFRTAARDYLARTKQLLGRAQLRDRPLTESDWQALPRFDWVPRATQPVGAVLFLSVLSLLVGGLAIIRFRRLELA